MARVTRAWVAALTLSGWLSVLDTVAIDTFANRATSMMLGAEPDVFLSEVTALPCL
jgi:hypothetical protein